MCNRSRFLLYSFRLSFRTGQILRRLLCSRNLLRMTLIGTILELVSRNLSNSDPDFFHCSHSLWLCQLSLIHYFFHFSIHGKENLLEGWSRCWCLPENLWRQQEEWQSSTPLLQKQWFCCTSHTSTIGGIEHRRS